MNVLFCGARLAVGWEQRVKFPPGLAHLPPRSRISVNSGHVPAQLFAAYRAEVSSSRSSSPSLAGLLSSLILIPHPLIPHPLCATVTQCLGSPHRLAAWRFSPGSLRRLDAEGPLAGPSACVIPWSPERSKPRRCGLAATCRWLSRMRRSSRVRAGVAAGRSGHASRRALPRGRLFSSKAAGHMQFHRMFDHRAEEQADRPRAGLAQALEHGLSTRHRASRPL